MHNKINEMFDLLLNEKTYSKNGITNRASYWKIGTSPFTTFDRFLKKIEKVDISNPVTSVLDKNNKTQEGNNCSYQFKIKDIDVTPCKIRGYVSLAAIHQYHSMLCAFGLGVDDKKYLNKKDFVLNEGKIYLVANIKELIKKENRMDLIKKLIVNSFFSNISDLRKIAYSILIEVLFRFNFNFSLLSLQNQIFYWNKLAGSRHNKTLKCASLINDLDKIKKDISKQGTIGTYKEIINFILNSYHNNLEGFINDIYANYKHIENESKKIDFITEQINEMNLKAQIKKEYSEFKEKIFEDRKNKKMIDTKSDIYSDIVDENNESKSFNSKFNESHACHILEKRKIEKLLKEKKLTEESNEYSFLMNALSDPNNGLMMNEMYHNSFDRGLWSFDANGKMLVHQDNEHYLFEEKGLKRIHINLKIFNDQMKEYLKNR